MPKTLPVVAVAGALVASAITSVSAAAPRRGLIRASGDRAASSSMGWPATPRAGAPSVYSSNPDPAGCSSRAGATRGLALTGLFDDGGPRVHDQRHRRLLQVDRHGVAAALVDRRDAGLGA